MRTLHPKDILTPVDYARVRSRFQCALRTQQRRLRVPSGEATLVFESRDSVLFQIHEVLRLESRWSEREIAREIREYECLVPSSDVLTATVLVDGITPRMCAALLDRLVRGEPAVALRVGRRSIAGELAAPALGPFNPVHYLRFRLSAQDRALLEGQRAVGVELCAGDEGVLTTASRSYGRRLAALLGETSATSLLAQLLEDEILEEQFSTHTRGAVVPTPRAPRAPTRRENHEN